MRLGHAIDIGNSSGAARAAQPRVAHRGKSVMFIARPAGVSDPGYSSNSLISRSGCETEL
jgi:hypothetical protein